MRRFGSVHLVFAAFGNSIEALPVLLYLLCLIGTMGSEWLCCVEPRANIEGLSHALWVAVVAIFAGRYGEVTPKTSTGHGLSTGRWWYAPSA